MRPLLMVCAVVVLLGFWLRPAEEVPGEFRELRYRTQYQQMAIVKKKGRYVATVRQLGEWAYRCGSSSLPTGCKTKLPDGAVLTEQIKPPHPPTAIVTESELQQTLLSLERIDGVYLRNPSGWATLFRKPTQYVYVDLGARTIQGSLGGLNDLTFARLMIVVEGRSWVQAAEAARQRLQMRVGTQATIEWID